MFRLRRNLPTTRPDPGPAGGGGLSTPRQWFGADVVGILLLAFFGLPLLAVGVVRTGELLRLYPSAGEGPVAFAALLVQEIGLLGVTLASVRYGYRLPLGQIGLAAKGATREVGLGLLAVVPLYLVQEGGMNLALWAFRLFLPAEKLGRLLAEENAALTALIGQTRPFALAFAAVLVLLAPLAEEVFFRGFVQEVLRERVGRLWTVALAALLFTVVHRYSVQFLPVLLVGLFLSGLYEWRRSLTAGITAHALLNLLALLKLLKDLP